MSWADVAAKNAPPPSEQPHPDQSLLEGQFEGGDNVHQVDGVSGVSVAPHDFKEHPVIPNQTTPETIERDAEYAASQREIQIKEEVERQYKLSKEYADELAVQAKAKGHELEEDLKDASAYAHKKAGEAGDVLREEGNKAAAKTKEEAHKAADKTKAAAAEAKKTGKDIKEVLAQDARDAKAFAKKEGAAAKKEAVSLYNTLAYQLSRPQVFVPLIGALDAALVGFLSYRAYIQREARIPFDQRTISTVAVGLGALFSLEAFGASSYFAKRDYNGNRKL